MRTTQHFSYFFILILSLSLFSLNIRASKFFVFWNKNPKNKILSSHVIPRWVLRVGAYSLRY